VAKGLINRAQLEKALALQKSSRGPAATLGQTLVSMGLINQEILDEIVAEQGKQVKKAISTG